MKRVGDSHVWAAEVPTPNEGIHLLHVSFEDAGGKIASDEIRITVGRNVERNSVENDQDNPLEAWPEPEPEHGLLGTQLGPNKSGKK